MRKTIQRRCMIVFTIALSRQRPQWYTPGHSTMVQKLLQIEDLSLGICRSFSLPLGLGTCALAVDL